MERQIAEFSAWLSRHAESFPRLSYHAHWCAERVEAMEIEPLRKKFVEVFGHEPSGQTILRMVVREHLHVLPDGWAMHGMGPQIPDYVTHAITLCGVETKMVCAGDIPGCNFPSGMKIRVWKL